MKKRYLEYSGFVLSERDRIALKLPKEACLVASHSQNTRTDRGRLRSGLGVEKMTNANGATIPFHSENDIRRIYAYTYTYPTGARHLGGALVLKTGAVSRYVEAGNDFYPTGKAATGQFSMWTDFDTYGGCACCIASSSGLISIQREGTVTVLSEKTNGGGCLFGDRLFYSLGQGVHFSDVGNHGDFAESAYGAGWIEFWDCGGKIGQTIPCEEGIVLLKNENVLLLKAKGAADDFTVSEVTYNGGQIVKGSAARCGKYVLFLSTDGVVYRVENGSAKRLVEGVRAEYCKDGVGAAGNAKNYFLCAEQRLLVMDAEYGTSYETIALNGFGECDGDVVGSYLGDLCRMTEGQPTAYGVKRTFIVADHYFADEKEKLIRKLIFYGTGTLTVAFGEGKYALSKQIELSQTGVEMEIEQKGTAFSFTFTLAADTVLEKMGVEYSYCGGEV